MDYMQITKQMMELNKGAFDNTFKIMTMLQEQAEQYVFSFLGKATWMPEEGKKAINEWLDTYIKGRESLKTYSDEHYKKAMDYFINAQQTQETFKNKKKS
jgi:hypothetical protein